MLFRSDKISAKISTEMSAKMGAGMREGMNSKMGIDIDVVLMLEFTWILMMIIR